MENQELQILQSESLRTMIQAEQESAMDIARRYPRQIPQVKNKIKEYATCDKETAASCFYSKPVAGKNVTGPSIRLAEMVAATYGNISYGSRVIGIDDHFVTIQAIAKDLENNISFSVEVKRSIRTKDNKRYPQHLIETTIKAAQAIGLRDAIYKVVPMGVFSQELKHIQDVGSGKVNVDGTEATPEQIKERAKAAVQYFINKGVTPERIFAALKVKKQEDIKDHHLVILTGFKNTLKEEEGVSITDLFPPTSEEQHQEDSKQTQDQTKASIIPKKEKKAEIVKDEVKENPKVDEGTFEVIDEYVKKFSNMGIKEAQIISYYGIDHVHSMEDKHVQDMISRYEAIMDDTMKPGAAYPAVKK